MAVNEVICPDAGHIPEFGTDPITGEWYNGTCTQTALEVCLAIVDGRTPTFDHMASVTRDMIAHNLCSRNGASTLAAIALEARRLGYTVATEWDYQQPLSQDWHALLMEHAGVNPILLQVANGQALVDVETGSRDESGLHYHAIAVCGKQSDGYICADGDNAQVNSRFQIYTYATLDAAIPCGLMMLTMPTHAPVQPTPQPGGTPQMSLAQGWSDDGTTLTAPNGVPIIHGFREYVLAHPEFVAIAGEPLAPEYNVDALGMDGKAHGSGAEQIFNNAALGYQANNGWIGPLWIGAILDAVAGQLGAANAQIAQLKEQLAAVPTQPIPTPTPPQSPVLTQFQQNAVNVYTALLTGFKEDAVPFMTTSQGGATA